MLSANVNFIFVIKLAKSAAQWNMFFSASEYTPLMWSSSQQFDISQLHVNRTDQSCHLFILHPDITIVAINGTLPVLVHQVVHT